MKKAKTSILGLAIILIALGLYNVFVFMLVKEFTAVKWLGYAFTTVAFLAQIFAGIGITQGTDQKQFLSLPLVTISSIYFVIQLIIGSVCLIVPFSVKAAVLIQVVVLAVYAIIALASLIGADSVSQPDGTDNLTALIMEAEQLYTTQEDPAKKAVLKKLYEAIRYSDPVSISEDVKAVDDQIRVAIQSLSEKIPFVTADNLKQEVKTVEDLIKKRNMICLSGK